MVFTQKVMKRDYCEHHGDAKKESPKNVGKQCRLRRERLNLCRMTPKITY